MMKDQFYAHPVKSIMILGGGRRKRSGACGQADIDRLDEVHHQMEETALMDAMEQIDYKKTARAEAELPNGKRLVRMDFAS